jgi:hypothetical protein
MRNIKMFMNDEMEGMWKEAVIVHLSFCRLPAGTERN